MKDKDLLWDKYYTLLQRVRVLEERLGIEESALKDEPQYGLGMRVLLKIKEFFK